jgi:hypothetical protein
VLDGTEKTGGGIRLGDIMTPWNIIGVSVTFRIACGRRQQRSRFQRPW